MQVSCLSTHADIVARTVLSATAFFLSLNIFTMLVLFGRHYRYCYLVLMILQSHCNAQQIFEAGMLPMKLGSMHCVEIRALYGYYHLYCCLLLVVPRWHCTEQQILEADKLLGMLG